MSSALDSLSIEGFRSIKSLNNFKLNNLNVIIGGNGAGKTNFVSFFRVLSAMMKENGLKEYIQGNADSFLYGGVKYTKRIRTKLIFGPNGYSFDLEPTENGFFIINDETTYYEKSKPWVIGSGNFDPALLREKDKPGAAGYKSKSWYIYDAIESWKIYHFHDTSIESGMRRYHEVDHSLEFFSDGSNIAPFLYFLHEEKRSSYDQIVNAVRLVTPFFDDFILKPNTNEKIRLNWKQKGLKDYPMNPGQLSDGSIRFICLATALLQPNPPSTIIIDEPELGLHPYAIEILAELIRATSLRTQIIISTQSPALVDCFNPEDIIAVNRQDGQSIFERLNKDDLEVWLEDYSLGDLWRKNIVIGGPSHE